MSVVPVSSKRKPVGERYRDRPQSVPTAEKRSHTKPFVPKVGELARVRPASEILNLVGEDCRTEGLPFHSQMLDWCGKPATVRRWVVNVCYQTESVAFGALD